MSRIFDALRKAASPVHPPQEAPLPESAPPLQAVAGRSAIASVARPSLERGDLVPLGFVAPVDESVQREMSALRISLDSLLPARVSRTVMFLSAQPGEGTSTVALQFAEALVRDAGQRVLLVDAQTRRTSPMLGEARSRARLSERQGPAALDLFPLADRLGRGGQFSARGARELLDAVSPGYDWVVVDAPPLLETPEAAPLGALADGVVLVVQSGRTKRPVLARAIDLLRRSGAQVLGTVLNRRQLEIPEFLYRRL